MEKSITIGSFSVSTEKLKSMSLRDAIALFGKEKKDKSGTVLYKGTDPKIIEDAWKIANPGKPKATTPNDPPPAEGKKPVEK